MTGSDVRMVLLACLAGMGAAGCGLLQPDQGEAFDEVEEIPAGKALVYVYRPSTDLAWSEEYEVSVNGRLASRISDGGYFPHFAHPGSLAFAVEGVGTKTSKARIRVAPGKTYYMKVHPRRDGSDSLSGTAQPKITKVSAQVAELEIIQCSIMLKE